MSDERFCEPKPCGACRACRPRSTKDARSFGERVRELREARGWLQYELAAKVDPPISRQQINLIEHGQSGGRDESGGLLAKATLLALCQALDARLVIDVNRPSGFVLELEPNRP